jgi:alanine dehydrogenase
MFNRVVSIGILRETKKTAESRVPLTPWQIARFMKENPQVRFVVQPSGERCFTDDEYRREGVVLCEDVSGCQLLLGIKEVNPNTLIPNKTYAFFAHVAKKQPHNQKLLQYVIRKKNYLLIMSLLPITRVHG